MKQRRCVFYVAFFKEDMSPGSFSYTLIDCLGIMSQAGIETVTETQHNYVIVF